MYCAYCVQKWRTACRAQCNVSTIKTGLVAVATPVKLTTRTDNTTRSLFDFHRTLQLSQLDPETAVRLVDSRATVTKHRDWVKTMAEGNESKRNEIRSVRRLLFFFK